MMAAVISPRESNDPAIQDGHIVRPLHLTPHDEDGVLAAQGSPPNLGCVQRHRFYLGAYNLAGYNSEVQLYVRLEESEARHRNPQGRTSNVYIIIIRSEKRRSNHPGQKQKQKHIVICLSFRGRKANANFATEKGKTQILQVLGFQEGIEAQTKKWKPTENFCW